MTMLFLSLKATSFLKKLITLAGSMSYVSILSSVDYPGYALR